MITQSPLLQPTEDDIRSLRGHLNIASSDLLHTFLVGCLILAAARTAEGSFLVSEAIGGIRGFNHFTGASEGYFWRGPELRNPEGMALGPDGHIYVVNDDISARTERVGILDEETGEFLGDFAILGESTFANRLAFGPSGDLFVSFARGAPVRRYDGSTGSFIDNFAQGGNLEQAVGMVFGEDGDLYVASRTTGQVKRYDGTSGDFIDNFASDGGLLEPGGLVFGPDGSLYVTSRTTNDVKRYDGTTGDFIDNFAAGGGLSNPSDLLFGPDGHLYVTSYVNVDGGALSHIKRFDGDTGLYLDDFATFTAPLYLSSILLTPTNRVPEPSTAVLLSCGCWMLAGGRGVLGRHFMQSWANRSGSGRFIA